MTEMFQLSSSSFPTQVADPFSNPSVQGTNHGDSSGCLFNDPVWITHAPFENIPLDFSLVGPGALGQEMQVPKVTLELKSLPESSGWDGEGRKLSKQD
jgi:hypothetical protein